MKKHAKNIPFLPVQITNLFRLKARFWFLLCFLKLPLDSSDMAAKLAFCGPKLEGLIFSPNNSPVVYP